MKKNQIEKERRRPEETVLTNIQQKRLSLLTGVDEKEISGKTIAQLSDELKWRIDPQLFFFKKICGKVVKKDPVTGVEYPVPFATVNVQDTDCNQIIYHPVKHPWSWHFPLFCHKEIIATTTTDACGNFCVWIPRFDIDWILHWRRHRICFPLIFQRPVIKDIISKFKWPPVPNPPDPAPWRELIEHSATILNSIGGAKANSIKNKIDRIQSSAALGNLIDESEDVLNERLFDHEVPPPLPVDFQKAIGGNNLFAAKGASVADGIRTNIGEQLGLDAGAKELEGFDYRNFRGPFYRCIDFYTPEWQLILDVPDITFSVTQDTNGDGIEEVIYAEGFFDVRWNAGAISNVKLTASSAAKESRNCYNPDLPCGNVPDILFAGFMPLRNAAYFDDVAGYSLRPNRPIPTGLPGGVQTSPATTPFCRTLQLYGCVDLQGAKFYRIHQSNGGTYSAITGLGWNNFTGSTPVPITADSSGWYPVEPINPVTLAPVPRASLEFPNLLLDWPTPLNEKSLLKIELGDASKNHISESNPVAIVSDNTVPDITVNNFSWKFEGESDALLRNLNSGDCPMIKRGATPRNIELVFEVFVSATHLRDASITTSGCGAGNTFSPINDGAEKPAHWHQSAADNSELLHQRYSLNSQMHPGCYTFSCTANGRSINPSGADSGNQLPADWFYNYVYQQSYFAKSVAVVNED